MKKTKKFYLVAFIVLSASLLSAVIAGTVSEEARKHMNRGQAAIEMARTPADYEEAVLEFKKAVQYAPDWPAAHYNLGIAQEKAGNLEESVQSLRTYLSLSSNAENREEVHKIIDQIEYRLERKMKNDARIAPLLGVWDRFDPETGEKFNAYTFTAKDGNITVSLFNPFGVIVVPTEFDGKNVSFKYVYKTPTFDAEYEVVAQMTSPKIIRGKLLSFVIRSTIPPIKVGKRGIVPTELRKQ